VSCFQCTTHLEYISCPSVYILMGELRVPPNPLLQGEPTDSEKLCFSYAPKPPPPGRTYGFREALLLLCPQTPSLYTRRGVNNNFLKNKREGVWGNRRFSHLLLFARPHHTTSNVGFFISRGTRFAAKSCF